MIEEDVYTILGEGDSAFEGATHGCVTASVDRSAIDILR